MSEEPNNTEQPPASAADATDAAAAATEGGDQAQKPEQKKREEVPIEELYDLTKPIPKVERPNRQEHDKELDEISKEIDVVREERGKVQDEIEEFMQGGKNSAIQAVRDEERKLRSQKGALIDEKKKIRAKLDGIRAQEDKLQKDRKDARSSVRYNNLDEINSELAKLQKKQETTSMSLNEEKRLIKEMDFLKASKAALSQMKEKESGLDNVREQRKEIQALLGAKDKEIDAVQVEIDGKQTQIKELLDKESDKRETIKDLKTRRDELRKSLNDLHKRRDEVRSVFREKNNAWYNFQRAIKAKKRMQYEEEKKKREEEMAAWLKKKEEEEAKKVPYEEEMALCDYLADYLTRTYLTDAAAELKKKQEEAEAKRKADVFAVKEDPFKGFTPMNKKKQDEDYFGKGKGKKKRDRSSKKEKKATTGPFTLNVDTFEQFGLLSLDPPTSLDQVAKSVEELRAKKTWFSEQPRGSVPTATEIRKANEKAAQKVKQSNGDVKNDGAGNKFSLSSDDFAPLGAGGGVSSMNANWGQKPAEDQEVINGDADAGLDTIPAEESVVAAEEQEE